MINMVKSVFFYENISKQLYSLARIYIINADNHNYNAVLARIRAKQQGLCRFCGRRIEGNDTIISKAYSKRPKYFHKKCAESINVL